MNETRASAPLVWTAVGLIAFGVLLIIPGGLSEAFAFVLFGGLFLGGGVITGVVGAVLGWSGH